VEMVVDESPTVVRSVGEDDEAVRTLRRSVHELADKVDPRFSEDLTLALLLAVLPPAAVEDRRSRHHLVEGENFGPLGSLGEFCISQGVLMVLTCLSLVASTILRMEGACSANLAYCGEGLCLLRWVGEGVPRRGRGRRRRRRAARARSIAGWWSRSRCPSYLNKGNNLIKLWMALRLSPGRTGREGRGERVLGGDAVGEGLMGFWFNDGYCCCRVLTIQNYRY
jgi:hypothetical protein